MSRRDKREVNAVHRLLMERYPKTFPKNYDLIVPLKTGVLADLTQRLPDVNPTLLRRALANHTARDGYLLALIHHRGDRRYDLEGHPVGTVTPQERAEALKKLDASTARGQAKAERVLTHKAREEKRRQQRETERKNREAKAARKAAHELKMREVAAHKAALEAQGIKAESRSERKRRLIREAAARADRRASAGQAAPATTAPPSRPPAPTPPSPPTATPYPPLRLKPKADGPAVTVEFKKRRRIVPPEENG